MTKKFALLLVAFLLVGMCLSMLGCQAAVVDEVIDGEEEEKEIKVGVIYSIVDPPRAGGWDRAQWPGHNFLADEYGWEVSIAEGVPYVNVAETAAEYAERGYDIVIFPDAGMMDAWFEVAPKYPDTWFFMMSVTDELPEGNNVAAWSHDIYTYGVVVGIVSGMATESGVVALNAGMNLPGLTMLFSGVVEGVKAVNADAEVLVTWVGDWVDVAKHSEVTKLQIDKGADVVFTITGPATKGVFEAAEAEGVFAIGYGGEWYDDAPGAILTSVIINTIPMYQEMADAFLAGTLKNQIYMLDVSCFSMTDFRGKLPDREAEIIEIVEKFYSGALQVPTVMHEFE